MTKRFTLTNPKNAFQEMKCGIDDKTFDKTLTFNEVVDRLNRFQDLSINDLKQIEQLKKENEQLKQQINELKEDVPLLLAFYRWYPFAVEKKEHQSYNRLWDFVND